MEKLSRRQFVGRSATGVAVAGYLSAGALELGAEPLGMPAGFQVFPVAKLIAKDFEGTLSQIAKVGYKIVEMCSPPGYVKAGFGALVDMKASEMRKIMSGVGLRCESCHYPFGELKQSLPERIAFAKELGQKQMIVSSFGLPKGAAMDDWRRAADEMNKMGEQTRKAGLQIGFHNHGGELLKLDGLLIYDELMKALDPKLTKMQCQISNVVGAGMDPVAFLTKYPGRFVSLHLADISAEKKPAPVGQGSIDWKKIFSVAKRAGVKNYFVEMNMEALVASYPYLHGLKV